MTVTRVDTNIAGSGNSAVPAGTVPATTATAPKTGPGNIKGPSGWTKPVKQGSSTAPAGVPRGTKEAKEANEAVNKALAELFDETALLQEARDRCNKNPEDTSLKEHCERVGRREEGARANLGQVIALK